MLSAVRDRLLSDSGGGLRGHAGVAGGALALRQRVAGLDGARAEHLDEGVLLVRAHLAVGRAIGKESGGLDRGGLEESRLLQEFDIDGR